MDDTPDSLRPEAPEPVTVPASLANVPINPWAVVRQFFACNPFYLMSAALLLYSFYLVSSDPAFLRTEVGQLSFNLGALQLYEMVVVATAIFLAQRQIWYDSTLLVGLENMLMLVPFMLISQAALIDARLVWLLCGAGGLIAAMRMGLLKRFIAELNFPSRSQLIGLVFLAVNMALPIVYRILHQSKFGTKPDWGAAYQTNQWIWWVAVPALCALIATGPLAKEEGKLSPQRRWLPLLYIWMWLTGTGVHLYCLGYVYDFDVRPELLAPGIWALCWTASICVERWLPHAQVAWKRALWIGPLVATMVAIPQSGKGVFLGVTLLNAAAYGLIYYRTKARLALHLLLISMVALLAGLPENWGRSLTGQFSREGFVAAAAAIYALSYVALSRNPKLGLLGAVLAAGVVIGIGPRGQEFHWAAQIGMAFLLLHSLRWTVPLEKGAELLRWFAAIAWVGHSMLWAHVGGGWMASSLAMPVLAVFLGSYWVMKRWGPKIVPAAAMLVLFSPIVHLGAVHMASAPIGLLAVVGSFALFGLGTIAALTRNKWAS